MAIDDEPKVQPAQVAIVGTKGEVLNKLQKPGIRRTHSDRRDFAQLHDVDELRKDLVQVVATVDKGISTAALEVGEKIYKQLSGETATYLEEMEQAIYERITRELEARSLRRKLRRLWWRIRPPAPELVVATTAAIEAMDPNFNGLEQALDDVATEEEYIPITNAGDAGRSST